MHRFLAGCGAWAPRWPSRPADAAAAAPAEPPEGDDLELMRKAHWAIDKVTNDMAGRFAFNTAIAAVMELVNERLPRCASGAAPSALHFATATAASLIFPFAPHTARRRLRAADRRARVGGAVAGRRPGAARARHRRGRRARSTASCATASQAPAGATREELEALARGAAERAGAHRRQGGRQGDRRAGKLVNFVVR